MTYLINYSTNLSQIGVGLQIQDFSRTHEVSQNLYFDRGSDGRFEENIEWPIYRMQSKAKLIDLIHNVPLVDSIMISKTCFQLFEKLNLPEYQVFPLKFIYKGSLIDDYIAFSIVKNIKFLDYISWDHSRFYKTSNYHQNIQEYFYFSSFEEMMTCKNQLNEAGFGLKADIKLNYNNEYDIISFSQFPMPFGFLCNEKTKDLIQLAKLTGFEIEPLPDSLFINNDNS